MHGNLASTIHGQLLGAAGADGTVTVVTELTQADFKGIGMQDIAGGNRQVVEAILGLAQNPG